jgi:hypothetical protein
MKIKHTLKNETMKLSHFNENHIWTWWDTRSYSNWGNSMIEMYVVLYVLIIPSTLHLSVHIVYWINIWFLFCHLLNSSINVACLVIVSVEHMTYDFWDYGYRCIQTSIIVSISHLVWVLVYFQISERFKAKMWGWKEKLLNDSNMYQWVYMSGWLSFFKLVNIS